MGIQDHGNRNETSISIESQNQSEKKAHASRKNVLAVQKVNEQQKQAETLEYHVFKKINPKRQFTKLNTNIINTREKQ